MSDNITKAELTMLEKMFTREIDCGLSKSNLPPVFQSKSKVMSKLNDKGLVEPVEFELPGRFAMKISGWMLTHSGRFTYCANC